MRIIIEVVRMDITNKSRRLNVFLGSKINFREFYAL